MLSALIWLMKKIERLVIADDLTGANDTGVHFLSDTESVEVVINPKAFSADIQDRTIDTLVINTQTRNSSPLESAEKVKTYLEQFLRYEPSEIYKKIDSTLRGNVGAEIDAVMQTSGYSIACVAPAVPRNGRTTLNGICYVHGIPLDETEFAKDPFSPVESSDAIQIITRQTPRKTGVFSLDTIRLEQEAALSKLKQMVRDGFEIIIVDSETREDLLKVKEIFSLLDKKVLYVGAAGFFHAIGSELSRIPVVPKSQNPKILFLTGSMMETSKKQCDWLLENGYVQKTLAVVSKRAVEDEKAEVVRVARAAAEEFRQNDIVLIHTDRDGNQIAETAGTIGDVLSNIVQRVVQNSRPDVLVVTGGETAMSVLSRLKVNSLHLIDEALPAVPVSLMQSPGNGDIVFISKAGSYGDTDVLEGIIKYINTLYSTKPVQEKYS